MQHNWMCKVKIIALFFFCSPDIMVILCDHGPVFCNWIMGFPQLETEVVKYPIKIVTDKINSSRLMLRVLHDKPSRICQNHIVTGYPMPWSFRSCQTAVHSKQCDFLEFSSPNNRGYAIGAENFYGCHLYVPVAVVQHDKSIDINPLAPEFPFKF